MTELGAIQNLGNTQGISALSVGVIPAKIVEKAQKIDLNDPVDTIELSTKAAKKGASAGEKIGLGVVSEVAAEKGASIGKKIGLGVASAVLPGLGQCINGDYAKGAAVFGTMAVAPALGLAATVATGGLAGLAIGGIAGMAAYGYGIYDAASNAKA